MTATDPTEPSTPEHDPASSSRAEHPPGFEVLAGERYLSLTTYRRTGEAVATPVWFALLAGPRAVVTTEASSGKVKRLRNDPACTIAPCDVRGRVHGPLVPATARIVEDVEEADAARRALARTYGWQWKAFHLAGKLRRRRNDESTTVILELSPSDPPR